MILAANRTASTSTENGVERKGIRKKSDALLTSWE